MLLVRDLHVYYGGLHALKGVNLEVKKGEIVAIIGRNGAGKTTLLNTLSGLVRAKKGSILFRGREITGLKPHQIVELGLYQVPEGRLIFSPLTVLENLELGAYLRTTPEERKKTLEDMEYVLELFPILKERLHQQAGTLSGGEQQMLAIGRALVGKTKLLILDEPSLGLAPMVVKEIFQIIARLRRDGGTILLVEQNARAALAISDRTYVMEAGRVVMEGPSQELLGREEVQKAYLGKKGR
ncbi:MAG: ABC transporter ATP-binding protein [Aquificota bacterium]|nr:MAG: ABC transporter ATP-binding protein [Aquificota bacterium]